MLAYRAREWLSNQGFLSQPVIVPHNTKCFDLKVIMLGDSGVGKSALLEYYGNNVTVNRNANPHSSTIGVDFYRKLLDVPANFETDFDSHNLTVNATIWDTAGQERFHAIIPSYLRDADAVVIVDSAHNEKDPNGMSEREHNEYCEDRFLYWVDFVRKHGHEKTHIVRFRNKCDLDLAKLAKKQNAELLSFVQRRNPNYVVRACFNGGMGGELELPWKRVLSKEVLCGHTRAITSPSEREMEVSEIGIYDFFWGSAVTGSGIKEMFDTTITAAVANKMKNQQQHLQHQRQRQRHTSDGQKHTSDGQRQQRSQSQHSRYNE